MPEGKREESIVVSVRVRPLNPAEVSSGERNAWDASEGNHLRCTRRNRSHGGDYTFDKVFGVDTASEAVYDDVARPLVDSAMHGLNATLFAYGQTGSGKTYTMNYITQSAGEDIFNHIASATDKQFLIKCTHLEGLSVRRWV